MKLLQNKFVVCVLGVLAIAIVANNLGAFKTSKKFLPAAGKSEEAKIDKSIILDKATSSNNAKISGEKIEQSQLPMDVSLVKMRLPQWVQAPGRDPFQHFSKQPDYEGVSAFLRLSAVWRQTRSRLAVINQKVVAEGDVIEDYRIERIEGERVWVQGPIGLEPLELELALTEAIQDRKKVKLVAKRKP